MERNNKWLMGLISRIDRAMPPRFEPMSARYEELFVSTAVIDNVIMEDKHEVLLRVKAQDKTRGQIDMFALGIINPDTCDVGDMLISEGRDRWRDKGKNEFLAPANNG